VPQGPIIESEREGLTKVFLEAEKSLKKGGLYKNFRTRVVSEEKERGK